MTKMSRSTIRILIILTVFSIAMGFMESAVVVYLREIYYPDGFDFPLKVIDGSIGITEILREAATMIMLIAAGIISGRTKTEKFGFFIFCFAIWDIFYYVFLKALLGWPASLLTWDILFLIPVVWVGPVVGTVINSLTMILLAILISYFTDNNLKTKIKSTEWFLLIIGSLVIIISYTYDYTSYMLNEFSFMELISNSSSGEMLEYSAEYIPEKFVWWIFIIGEMILLLTIASFFFRNKRVATNPRI